MSGYIGTKAVTLSTTSASVGGDSTVGGDLTVDTNTLYVDSANNRVGVGTVLPSYLFHASGSGDAVAAVTAGATSIAALNLGNSTNLADGGIRYDNSADALIFRSANAERLRILSSGGITFNGDTAAANALSDYEEGTWTASSSEGTVTAQGGATYTKIGNLVTIYADLRSFSERTSTGTIRINGLPFTAAKRSVGACMHRYISDIPTNGGLVAYVDSSNYVNFLSNGGTGNWRGTQYADLDSSAAILAFTITYQV